MDKQDKALKVAIVGGGMCGLATAIGLTKAGFDVDIYEAAAKLGEVGAGVGLGPNAIRVLRELGILDEVVASVHPEVLAPRQFRFLFGLGEHEIIYDYPVQPEDDGLGIHRVTFLEALIHLVDASKTHCSKRCIGLQVSGSQRVQIAFADGTSAEADVVIGADGIRSAVRAFVVEGSPDEAAAADGQNGGLKVVRAKFTNTLAYRGLIPVEKLKSVGMQINLSERLHCFIGPGKLADLLARPQHILTFPIKLGTVINVVAFSCDFSIPWGARPLPPGAPWVTPRSTEELLETYKGFGREVQLLLGCLERPSVWAVHAVDPPLESYVRGRVAVIGDAAHGMLPYLGAGAGQGLEDALVIVRLLTHAQTRVENVEDVLKAYDTVRRPHANMVLADSTKMGDVYDEFGPSGPTAEGIREDLKGKWDKVWSHDILADVDTAVNQLVEAGAFAK